MEAAVSYCKSSLSEIDVIFTSVISDNVFCKDTELLTKAVVAKRVLLSPAEGVGAVGDPVNIGLSLGENSLSKVKVEETGDIETVARLGVLSEIVTEPPESELTVTVFWEESSTVIVLTVCVTVAVSLAIR